MTILRKANNYINTSNILQRWTDGYFNFILLNEHPNQISSKETCTDTILKIIQSTFVTHQNGWFSYHPGEPFYAS